MSCGSHNSLFLNSIHIVCNRRATYISLIHLKMWSSFWSFAKPLLMSVWTTFGEPALNETLVRSLRANVHNQSRNEYNALNATQRAYLQLSIFAILRFQSTIWIELQMLYWNGRNIYFWSHLFASICQFLPTRCFSPLFARAEEILKSRRIRYFLSFPLSQ